MWGFGDNDNGQQPQEKSFLSRAFSFITKAVMVVAMLALSVITLTLFSDTVRDKLDEMTKDKDGKGGWGTKLREAVSGEKDRTPLDSAKEWTSSKITQIKEYFTPAEDKGPTAGDLMTAGAGAYVANKVLKKSGSVEDGKFTLTPGAQAKVEKAVAENTKKAAELRVAEKEAAKKVEELKPQAELEKQANKGKGLLEKKYKKFTNDLKIAEKDLGVIRKSLTEVETIITEGNAALSGTKPSTTTLGKHWWQKIFGKKEAAAQTETLLLEDKPRTYAQSKIPQNNIGAIDLPDASAKPTIAPASAETPAVNTKIPQIMSAPTPPPPPPVTPPTSTINVTANPIEKPSLPPVGSTGETTSSLSKTGIFSSATNSVKGFFAPLTQAIEPIVPALQTAGKWLGYTGAVATATDGGIHAKDLWQKKDKDGDFTSRDSAVSQGIGTVMEAGGMAGTVLMKTPLPFMVGTAAKDITYTANVIATGNNPELTKSATASMVEWIGGKIGADKPVNYILDKTVGEKYDAEKDATNRQKQNIADDKTAADKIKALPEDKQAIIRAWQDKANANGLYKVNPLMLLEHVEERGWQPPPPTPNDKAAAKDTQK